MNKTIEKIESYKAKEIEKAIAKSKAGFEEAKDYYTDSGYDRYFKKMQKCEAELQELEDYLNKGETKVIDLNTEQYKEYVEMKNDLKSLVNQFFYMFADLNLPETAAIQGIQRILEKYKYTKQ